MNISYSKPLSLGWDRMKNALFRPFDLSKWFRVGFTAWLAGLTDCNGGGNYGGNSGGNRADWDYFFRLPDTAWDWIQSHPLWFNLIILGLVLLFIIVTVLTWVSSRGKFMFLYNVANDKSEVSMPWHEWRKQGNSLFLWRFFFGWLGFLIFIAILVFCFMTGKNLYLTDAPDVLVFWGIAQMIFIFLAYAIIVGYISLFLNDFVVPIMYKHKVNTTRGWLKFLPLWGKNFFTFLIYGMFIFVLGIAVVAVVIFFALVTCCIGLLLLIIPFIGAVVLLPVSYVFRALSIEFLAQFGEEYNVFPQPAEG